MNLRKKLAMALVAAGLVTTGAAHAAFDQFTSGNSSLFVSLVDSTNNISALFDLGTNLDSVLANANTAGFNISKNISTGDYAAAYKAFFTTATAATTKWNVFAGDSLGAFTIAQDQRYLSTSVSSDAVTRGTNNGNLGNFANANNLLTASVTRGNHGTVPDGANTATYADFTSTFGTDKFAGTSPFLTLSGLNAVQNTATNFLNGSSTATGTKFWYLANTGGTSTQKVVNKVFGTDLNSDGVIGTGEYGLWNVNANGSVTFFNPTAVPEADTWAMFAAGLIAVGAIARRRLSV